MMPDFLAQYESVFRFGIFLSVFAVMAALEALAPRRKRYLTRTRRWSTNGLMALSGAVAISAAMPLLAIGAAEIATARNWGLFNLVAFPGWLEFIAAVILLDLAIYAQHVATHKIPILWRLHKVHHTDRDIDASTALRFHPVEIILSMIYKIAIVFLLGPAALAVFVFEVLLNASALFNHANVRLPLGLDRLVRLFLVTPDMHRVHHSVLAHETNSNYGFCLPIWDRLFGTYRAEPEAGHAAMTIGLDRHQTDQPGGLIWSLLLPFRH